MDKVAQIRRAASRLFEELGREPSDTEVAEELGVPTKRVVRLKKHSMTLVSLDAPRESGKSNAHGTKETTWEETTPDETARSPADIIADKELLETSQDALCNLTPREVLIISSRFGLNGGNPQTLEDIGKRLGITRERVRQIQKQAIIRLQLHEVTRRNIGHTEKAEVHKKEKTLRAALKRPKKKKVNPLFFPVVTKFQQWRPTNGEREDTRAAALSLVAFAYDLPYASVLTAGTERATWARSVAIDLMKKYAIENRGICEIFNASTDDFVAVALTRVSSACRYKNIQDDIAGLDQHLWHIIALLKATA